MTAELGQSLLRLRLDGNNITQVNLNKTYRMFKNKIKS
jgi:hypothetical protein